MDLKFKYRLRMENCIGTIMDLHKRTGPPDEDEALLHQFEKLKKAVKDMDMSHVSEDDVLMVEQATNTLLAEFGAFDKGENRIFADGGVTSLYH